MRRLLFRLAAAGLGLVAAWLAAEALIVAQDRDLIAVRRLLYYQATEVQLYQPTDSGLLHYTPLPDSQLAPTTIGPTGLRNPTPPDDAEGPRILFGGGSTIFGVRVNDAETLPARLGHHLGASVWNLGASAYVEAQVLDRARIWLERLRDVDLVLVMITNPGRRPFLSGDMTERRALRARLWRDPGFADENLPPPWGPERRALQHRLLLVSPAWRYFSAVRAGQLSEDDPLWDPTAARTLAAEGLRRAAAERGVKVVFVDYPRNVLPCEGCWRGDAVVDLLRPGLTMADTDLHPPAAVLDAHAATLASKLRAAGLISTNR